MDRSAGPSVRLKLTLSYAGFLMLAGALLLAAAWLAGQYRQSFDLLLRYVPDGVISTTGRLVPGNSSFLLRAFAPAASIVLAFLLVFGLLGGWLLAGRMLAPLTRITDATRVAANGSLAHRIRLPGRRDEFRELADAFDAMLARLEAHVAEQQRFAANASHELRTPLAITQTLLDVARNDLNRDTGELAELVLTAFQVDPVGERPGRGDARGVGDAGERGEHAAGEKPPSQETEYQQERQRDGRGRSESAQEAGVVPGH